MLDHQAFSTGTCHTFESRVSMAMRASPFRSRAMVQVEDHNSKQKLELSILPLCATCRLLLPCCCVPLAAAVCRLLLCVVRRLLAAECRPAVPPMLLCCCVCRLCCSVTCYAKWPSARANCYLSPQISGHPVPFQPRW